MVGLARRVRHVGVLMEVLLLLIFLAFAGTLLLPELLKEKIFDSPVDSISDFRRGMTVLAANTNEYRHAVGEYYASSTERSAYYGGYGGAAGDYDDYDDDPYRDYDRSMEPEEDEDEFTRRINSRRSRTLQSVLQSGQARDRRTDHNRNRSRTQAGEGLSAMEERQGQLIALLFIPALITGIASAFSSATWLIGLHVTLLVILGVYIALTIIIPRYFQ